MQKAKILVVDDDPDLVRAMRLRLRATTTTSLPPAMAMAQSPPRRKNVQR